VYIRVLRSFGHITNISPEMLLVTSGKVTDYVDIESICKYCKQFVLPDSVMIGFSRLRGVYDLTHCGRVTQICVFTLQLCRTGDANLRF